MSVTADRTTTTAAEAGGFPEEALVRPLTGLRPGLVAGSLVTGLLAGLLFYAWAYQIENDLGVAGINRPVFWGFYISNFVFWIGISHAGTLISAILRVTQAEWRRPVTRCAEAITAFALSIGGLFPIIHLGRPWLFWYVFPLPNARGLWPNFRSPLIWDVMAITTYLTASVVYLLLPMIPDFAILRDRAKAEGAAGLRARLYRALALGWRGTPQQWHSLESGIRVMAIIIIPVAVSVHTIVSWDFSMTLQPMWHSTIFGPYFVVGAIYSGIAVLMVAMYVLRRGLHLEAYLSDKVFNNLGLLFVAFALIWGYFTFAEHLTVWYGSEPTEMVVFWQRARGDYAGLFWLMVLLNVALPLAVLPFRRGRGPLGTAIVGVGVLGGMWIERFLIVVGTLRFPRLDFTPGSYTPAWVEVGILFGSFGLFLLLYFLFVQLAPIVSIWEVREGEEIASRARRRHGSAGEPSPAARPVPASEPTAAAPRTESRGDQLGIGSRVPDGPAVGDRGSRVRAVFADGIAARRALARLEGTPSPDAVEVRSSVPLHDAGIPGTQPTTRVPWMAILGGVLGGLGNFLLASLTSHAYPLPTGGMPIVPGPPIAVVTFEGIAVGAILFTIGTVFFESGLLTRRHRPDATDRYVAEGRVTVAVEGGDPDGEWADGALLVMGAETN